VFSVSTNDKCELTRKSQPFSVRFSGHPYIELQHVSKNHVEVLPDWLLDPTLRIEVKESGFQAVVKAKTSSKKAKTWSKKLQATRVHFYHAGQNGKSGGRHHGVVSMQHDDSSDDSDSDCKDDSDWGRLLLKCLEKSSH
jgi:hypothetical protein